MSYFARFTRTALFTAVSALTAIGCVAHDDDDDVDDDEIAGDDDDDDDDDDVQERRVTLCNQELTESDFVRFLDGNLVIVAAVSDEGSSKSQAIADLAVMMVLNGIDFANLGSARPDFSDGRYSLATGDSEIGFELFFSEDFEQWKAGDAIPHSVFDPESYAQNIQVELDTSEFPPTVSLDWDPGPLAGLVEGEIDIDETSLAIKVRLRTDLVDIEVDSGAPYENVWALDDSLWLQMETTRINLSALAGDLEEAGFGFSYDETTYESPLDDLEQEFYGSEFLTLLQDNGNYRWEGDYQATVRKGSLTMYQQGFASNGGDNHTEYYCDEGRTQRVGVAEHDDSLFFGEFVFDNGERFAYGIQ